MFGDRAFGEIMLYPLFESKPLIPSKSAMNELMKCNLTLSDAVEILEQGFDCSVNRRKKGTIERCIKQGKKTLKVVAVKSFNYSLNEECWLLVHVGIF